MPRKRTHAEVEAAEPPSVTKEPSLIQRIRNMWEFASVMQYIFMFGKVMKIDEDFDIEDFENECLKPGYSDRLEEIGLQMLRFVSSNRGLNFDNWDEYVRRQYQSKAPNKNHPYGDEEQPNKFRHFDVFTRVRVLHQLSIWTFWNPDRIRGALPDARESEQLDWRMNVFGWDEDDREYFVLDDSRLYRRTEPPPPQAAAAPKWKPKANSIKARAERRRASKRRKLEEAEMEAETQEENDGSPQPNSTDEQQEQPSVDVDTFGGYKWECVAITLDDYQGFINSLRTSIKNYPNERAMRDRLIEEVLPTIQELADKQRRKQERRERELQMMERMAGAKRSSRLADKQERERRDHEEAEVARKHEADLAAAHKEQERQAKMEQERQSRMMTREQRIKDREYKRLLMEEELARDAEEHKKIAEGEKRGSERHIREKIEKNKKVLEELVGEEEWTFDCSGCGVHGKNLDDGSHSIACEKCNVWQHSKCLGISKAAAEKDDFSFVCGDCRNRERQEARRKEEEVRRKEEEANKPKIMLKFKPGQSSSPPQQSAQTVQPGTGSAKPIEDSTAHGPAMHLPRPMTNGYNGTQYSSDPHLMHMQPGQASDQSPSKVPSQPYYRPQQQQSPSVTRAGPPPFTPSHYTGPNLPTQPFQGTVPSSLSQQPRQHLPPADIATHHATNYLSQPQQNYQQIPPSHTPSPPVHSTPVPNHSQHYQQGRLPSPILNKPKMSPTQGNPDVGPIAGVPNSSPGTYHPALFTVQPNGSSRPEANGISSTKVAYSPPQRTSQTPQAHQLSGLSPIKRRSPLPPASVPEKQPGQSISPPMAGVTSVNSFSFGSNESVSGTTSFSGSAPGANFSRNVSGTPILPPTEKLAPSPEHIDRGPVPTPSKQPIPSPHSSFESPNAVQYQPRKQD